MALYKKLNPLKRKLFKYFTSSFKNSKNLTKLALIDKSFEGKILISRPNHRLGNQLLLSPLIQELENNFPNSKIDLIVNGSLSNKLYTNFSSINTVYNLPSKPFKHLLQYLKVTFKIISNKYIIAITGCETSNSSKIFVKLSKAKFKIFNSGNEINQNENHIAKVSINNLRRFLNKKSPLDSIYPKLDIKLNVEESNNGKKIIDRLFNNKQLTLCVFTYATGQKILTKKWWHNLTNEIEHSFPQINILEILPKENVSQLDFKYINYNTANLREMAAIIENSILFIGADSGIMHLATSTNTPTLGLFNGATDPNKYSPYGKHKESININEVTIKEIISKIKKYA